MQGNMADQLEALAREAAQLARNLETYWVDEGVSELGIFIDPDLYQYVEKLYREARDFAARCQVLTDIAGQLRSG